MGSTLISRRQLAFWCGFGFASITEGSDPIAADLILSEALPSGVSIIEDASEPDERIERQIVEHWTAAKNARWRWYERENLVDGFWKKTGITTPIDRASGTPIDWQRGYVAEAEIPTSVLLPEDRRRLSKPLIGANSWQERYTAIKPRYAPPQDPETIPIHFGDRSADDAGRSAADRRSRHGRPPSQWLRSLTAEEIRDWLAKVEIQDAHVRGMTFWTHLTRDHLFEPDKIKGLTESELAELHGAAHEGF